MIESSDNYPEKYYGFRTSRWKYLYRESDLAEELYDLRSDPSELNNLASAEPELLADLRKRCSERLKELRASAITRSPDSRVSPYDEISPETREELRALGYAQ